MHGMEAFLGQLEARRATLVEERNAAYARRQAALDCKRDRKARTFSPEERQVYGEAMSVIGRCDENLAAIDQRIQHQKNELVRAGKGNPTVERIMRGGRGGGEYAARSVVPLSFSPEQLRKLHRAVVEQRGLRLEARDTVTSPDSLLPPELSPTYVIGPQYENRLMDRLPVVPAFSPSIEYIQHLSTTGVPAVVAESALKPELFFNYQRVVAEMNKLAAHTSASWEALNDFATFQGYVGSELLREVVAVENDELINGDGTTGHTVGLLATSGILTHTVATGETALDAVESSIAALRTGPALATANVLVLHPNTWSAMRKAKDNYGRYLIAPDPTRDVTDSLWGVSILQTTQIAAGAAVLLDTSKFGRIHLRESLSLRVGFANDDLIRNLTRFVAEERWLLAVERPAAVLSLTGLPTS